MLSHGSGTRLNWATRLRLLASTQSAVAAVAFTPEQFEALLERLAGRRDAQAATATLSTKTSRRRITSKEIRLVNFDGTAASWTNWSFGFKVAVRSVCTKAFELLKVLGLLTTKC